jgi:dihydrofolate reductase
MSKLVLAMFMSLDGYIEGPDGKIVPPPWSNEVAERWATHNLENAGHLLYGRVNFQFNRDYWTSPAASRQTETPAMNRLPKTVVSRTLKGDPGWNGSLADGELAEAVARLKRTITAGDIYCFGGAGLAHSLMDEDLIDEYYLMVTPALLGGGKRLFDSGFPEAKLKLLEARALDVGSVILHYQHMGR